MGKEPKIEALCAVDAHGEPLTLGEFNGFEIYPMPMFATLAVTDVSAMSNWYANALGFAVVFQGPPVKGQPSMVHLRRGKYQDVLLVPASGATDSHPQTSVTLTVQSADVETLAARARAAPALDASSVEGPTNTPWNTRDLRVTDPCGHRLVFTCRATNPDSRQVARWSEAFDAARKK